MNQNFHKIPKVVRWKIINCLQFLVLKLIAYIIKIDTTHHNSIWNTICLINCVDLTYFRSCFMEIRKFWKIGKPGPVFFFEGYIRIWPISSQIHNFINVFLEGCFVSTALYPSDVSTLRAVHSTRFADFWNTFCGISKALIYCFIFCN